MSSPLVALGIRVRIARESLGLSQEQFADRCGFDRTYISLIERGKRNISLLNLVRIANGLETSISSITEGIDSGPNSN